LEELEQQFNTEIYWRSYELRPAGSPPIPPAYRARIEQNRPIFAQRVKDDHGVVVQAGPFGINSRPALILEKYAQAQGKGRAYHRVVERAYWTQALDISRLDVLDHLLKSVDLHPPELDAIFADDQYEREVEIDIMLAQQIGIQGVPAVIVDKRYYIAGAQPYAAFEETVRQALADRGGD
jgi:predicted DsbA family dithiol-disulfide isomerase